MTKPSTSPETHKNPTKRQHHTYIHTLYIHKYINKPPPSKTSKIKNSLKKRPSSRRDKSRKTTKETVKSNCQNDISVSAETDTGRVKPPPTNPIQQGPPAARTEARSSSLVLAYGVPTPTSTSTSTSTQDWISFQTAMHVGDVADSQGIYHSTVLAYSGLNCTIKGGKGEAPKKKRAAIEFELISFRLFIFVKKRFK
jgi:hypothetical protein